MLARSPEETEDQGNDRVTADAVPPLPEPPRKAGRPKGLPKTGGRTKGGKNWSNEELRKTLLNRSNAPEVLADIVAGRPLLVGAERTASETGPGKPVWRYPTIGQRLQALQVLLAKVLPDMKATELTATVDQTNHTSPMHTDRKLIADTITALKSAKPGDIPAEAEEKMRLLISDVELCVGPLNWETNSDDAACSTATALEEGEEVTASPSIPPPATPGTFIELSPSGAGILFEQILADARERWCVMDSKWGQVMSRHWSQADAEHKCTQLIEQRRI